MSKYRTDGEAAGYNVICVNYGGYNPYNPSDEANLDVHYSEGMANPAPFTFYSTGKGLSGTDDWDLAWVSYLLSMRIIPVQTISISYGETERENLVGYAYHLCGLLMQLGAHGVSVLCASGNSGVGKGDCLTSNGSIRFGPCSL